MNVWDFTSKYHVCYDVELDLNSLSEKEDDYILLSDLYSKEDSPTHLKLSIDQYLNILDDWQKVCEYKPKEVIIKKENGVFSIETKD